MAAAVAYATLLHPVSAWRDGPEFTLTAWVLGIAHPAGFPLYNAMAWIWEQLPVGNIAFRSHLFSLLATMLAAVALYHLACSWTRCVYGRHPDKRDASLAGFISLCWLAMPAQVENAIQAEVYALHALFTFVIGRLLLDFIRNRQGRYLFLAAFLTGLGAANHATLGALLFALVIAVSVAGDWREMGKYVAGGVFAGCYGLLAYLYLPVRSSRDPAFDWGNTEKWERFWHHVFDRKDAGSHFQGITDTDRHPGMEHLLTLYDWLGPVGVFLLLAGWIWLLWRRPRLAFMMLSWVVVLFVFFLGWKSSTVLTGALGVGLLGLVPIFHAGLRMVDRNVHKQATIWVMAGLAMAVFLPVFSASIPFAAQRGGYLSREIVAAEYYALPYRATVLAGISSFHLYSLARLEGARPDVSIVSLAYVISPHHFKPLEPEDIPLLAFPDIRLPEVGDTSDEVKSGFLYELVRQNEGRSRFYAELNEDYLTVIWDNIYPDAGLWAAVDLDMEDREVDCGQIRQVIMDRLVAFHAEKELLYNREAQSFLSPQIYSWNNLMSKTPHASCATASLHIGRWWLQWMHPGKDEMAALYNDFGVSLAKLGHDQGAYTMFQLSRQAGYANAGTNLGVWYELHGRINKAIQYYRESFLDTGDTDAYLALQRASRKKLRVNRREPE